jgi:mono/diheme cytochrome c family protein
MKMKQLLVIVGMGMLFSVSAQAATSTPDGQAIFDKSCSVCHSVNPPPKSAPPIVPIASRYHMQFKSKAEGVNHLVAYMKSPDSKKAVDPQAVARFGLMPAVQLPEQELRTVAGWVWDQYNPAMGRGRGFGGQGPMNPNRIPGR